MRKLYDEIETERAKLAHLVSRAIRNKQPLGTDDAILAQSRRVDTLVARVVWERKKEKEG